MRRSSHPPGLSKPPTSVRSNHTQTASFAVAKRQPINHLHNLQKEAAEKNMSDRVTQIEYQLLHRQEIQANRLITVIKGSIALHAVTLITVASDTIVAGLCHAFNVSELSFMIGLTNVFFLNTAVSTAVGVVGCFAGYRADQTYKRLQKKLL